MSCFLLRTTIRLFCAWVFLEAFADGLDWLQQVFLDWDCTDFPASGAKLVQCCTERLKVRRTGMTPSISKNYLFLRILRSGHPVFCRYWWIDVYEQYQCLERSHTGLCLSRWHSRSRSLQQVEQCTRQYCAQLTHHMSRPQQCMMYC